MDDELDSLLSGTVRQILHSSSAGRQPFDAATWAVLEDAGLTRIELPERSGGGGGRFSAAAAVVRASAEFATWMPIGETLTVANWVLDRAAIAVPDGPLTYGIGASLELSEGRDGWHVSGVIPRVPYGRAATCVAVVATSNRPLVVVVDREQSRVELHENLAGEPRDDIYIDDAVLPSESVGELDAPGVDEFGLRRGVLRLLLMAGNATKTLELTVRHVAERVQFGRPLAEFQSVQHKLAEMANETTCLSVMADAAIRALEYGSVDAAQVVSSGRLYAIDSARKIAETAHQLHGAIGTTIEHPLHSYTTRLLAWRTEDGTEKEWTADLAAISLLKGNDLWTTVTGYEIGAP